MESSYEYSTPTTHTTMSTTSSSASPEMVAFFVGATALVFVVAYVIQSLILMLLFKKAGLKAWKAWVPFYNTWKLFEIGGVNGGLSLLMLIPLINIVALVFMYIAMYRIGLKLGKSGAFVLLGIFFPPVWYLWLGLDSSKWNDSLSEPRKDTPDVPQEPVAAAPTVGVNPATPAGPDTGFGSVETNPTPETGVGTEPTESTEAPAYKPPQSDQ